MHPVGILFTLIAATLQFTLPRKWACVPMFLAAGLMTRGQQLDIGPLHLSVVRILVIVGFIRAAAKGERIVGGLNRIDWAVIAWAICLIFSSVFHTSDAWVTRIGTVWNDLGCYFLFRIFITSTDDVMRIFKALAYILVPVAITMMMEKTTHKNVFAFLGGIEPEAVVRHGKVRAHGPFFHAILAGSAGASCVPIGILFWKKNKKIAIIGGLSALLVVYASGSSGPMMTVFAILGAMAFWRFRQYLYLVRWGIIAMIILLQIVMKDPFYYILARIDITGGSTGWHRAELIHSGITHLGEWWLGGTDYTRHWMPTGIHANEIHTDITNHYLQMGVWGGLPLMCLFIWIIVASFKAIGMALRKNKKAPTEKKFLIWTLGCILLGHATNILSICYFDQSIMFLYLLFASIACLKAERVVERKKKRKKKAVSSQSHQPYPHHEPNLAYNR